MPLLERVSVPLAGVLVAGLLGLAPAPATASGGASYGASVDEPRPAATAARVRVPRTLHSVRDPRGDVHHPYAAARGRVHRPHADILRATYRTPWTAGTLFSVTVKWAQLRDGRRAGARPQKQLTLLQHPRSGRLWFFHLDNAGGPVRMFEKDPETGEDRRVRPRRLTVERVPGVGGRTIVRFSAEWLPVDRVRFHTFSESRDAVDDVNPSWLMDVARD